MKKTPMLPKVGSIWQFFDYTQVVEVTKVDHGSAHVTLKLLWDPNGIGNPMSLGINSFSVMLLQEFYERGVKPVDPIDLGRLWRELQSVIKSYKAFIEKTNP